MRQLWISAVALGLGAVPAPEANAQQQLIDALIGPVPAATREIATELAGSPSQPSASFLGLALVFRTFAESCLAMDAGSDPIDALPETYSRVGSTAYTLGRPVPYEETSYVLTPTGDADADTAGGHVTLTVTDGTGSQRFCGLDWPLRPGFTTEAATRMAQMLQIQVPYEFRAIPIRPPSGRRNPYPPELAGFQPLARACGATWCELVVTWRLQPDRSDPYVTLRTYIAPEADGEP